MKVPFFWASGIKVGKRIAWLRNAGVFLMAGIMLAGMAGAWGTAEALVIGSQSVKFGATTSAKNVSGLTGKTYTFGSVLYIGKSGKSIDFSNFPAGPLRDLLIVLGQNGGGAISDADLATIVQQIVNPKVFGSVSESFSNLLKKNNISESEFSIYLAQFKSTDPVAFQTSVDLLNDSIGDPSYYTGTVAITDPSNVDFSKFKSADQLKSSLEATGEYKFDPSTNSFTHNGVHDLQANMATEEYQAIKDPDTPRVVSDPNLQSCISMRNVPWMEGGDGGGDVADGGSTGSGSAMSAVPVVTNKTVTPQSVANPVLAVGTDRAAYCQYSTSSFNYGAGTSFGTSGNYEHNTTLNSIAGGDHTYYVICKDAAGTPVSAMATIPLKIDLSKDPNNAPVITNTTSDHQVSNEPILSVSTNKNATCQYKKDADFTYGGGTQFTIDGELTHSVSLSLLADGQYSFYVVCKDKVTEAFNDGGKQILTTLDRAANPENAPVITNTTNAAQTTVTPILSVTTAKAATCQYKEAASFTYGNGTDFVNTGLTNHSAQMATLKEGTHTFYVVCKDAATKVVNPTGIQVIFTVNLNSPKITNTTPEKQTGADPLLSATTDRQAVCQYKENNDFAYGAGTQFTIDGDNSHSVSLKSLADGSHIFYVVCKDVNTGIPSSGMLIKANLDRAAAANEPVITNTTLNYQNTSNPILSVVTTRNSSCQYKENSDFAYGMGGQFDDDGTNHTVQLSFMADGNHTFYVVCKDTATGKDNSKGMQIIFKVSNNADICANLASNDRVNDGNRSNANTTSASSVYLWQAVEEGTREKFDKVDWYAGYQFTAKKDGRLNQLCGLFENGITNKVILYNGAYSELANVSITGTGFWKCANVAVAIKTDKRYYVIARVQNNPVYFEYKSALLPKNSGQAVLETGIRQLADKDFGEKIVNYDYMMLGLVDARINFSSQNDEGPELMEFEPNSTEHSTSVKLSFKTSEDGSCRFDRDDVAYDQMDYAFARVAATSYAQKICGLEKGDYTFYVRCKSSVDGKSNSESGIIQFKVE